MEEKNIMSLRKSLAEIVVYGIAAEAANNHNMVKDDCEPMEPKDIVKIQEWVDRLEPLISTSLIERVIELKKYGNSPI